jgi:hypothetical protein
MVVCLSSSGLERVILMSMRDVFFWVLYLECWSYLVNLGQDYTSIDAMEVKSKCQSVQVGGIGFWS